MRTTPRQRVIAYVVLVVAFALAAHYAAPKAGGGASAFVVMWTPALAALAAGVLTRRSLGAIGWRPWPVKWLAAGWIIPSLYAFPAYGFVWLSGLGSVPSPTFLERACRPSVGRTGSSSSRRSANRAGRHRADVCDASRPGRVFNRITPTPDPPPGSSASSVSRCRSPWQLPGMLAPPADVGRSVAWRHRESQ